MQGIMIEFSNLGLISEKNGSLWQMSMDKNNLTLRHSTGLVLQEMAYS